MKNIRETKLLANRIHTYDLLRKTFIEEPTESYLKNVLQTIFNVKYQLVSASDHIGEGVNKINDYLKQYGVSNAACDSLYRDYMQLFIGPDKLSAPLWESVYLSDDRLLFQEPTLHVRKQYAKYGFHVVSKEPDDHLGIELDFMYQTANIAQGLYNVDFQQYLEVQRDSRLFLVTHLLNWVPDLARDVTQNAKTDFYRGMARLLGGCLELDLVVLDELIQGRKIE